MGINLSTEPIDGYIHVPNMDLVNAMLAEQNVLRVQALECAKKIKELKYENAQLLEDYENLQRKKRDFEKDIETFICNTKRRSHRFGENVKFVRIYINQIIGILDGNEFKNSIENIRMALKAIRKRIQYNDDMISELEREKRYKIERIEYLEEKIKQEDPTGFFRNQVMYLR